MTETVQYRGCRCPLCFWALYDGDWCQGPDDCPNRGKSVKCPVRLTNEEAAKLIAEKEAAKNTDPTGDEFMAKTMLWIAAVLLGLLLIGLLGCATT